MKLNRHNRERSVPQSFDTLVVEIDDGYFPIGRCGNGGPVDIEPMILSGDGYRAGTQVFHRMVSTTVTELELARIGAYGAGKQLMTEANSEIRDIGIEGGTHDIETSIEVLRISRTGRDDDTVRFQCRDIGVGRSIWDHCDNGAPIDERLDDIEFDTDIDHDDMRSVTCAETLKTVLADEPDDIPISR